MRRYSGLASGIVRGWSALLGLYIILYAAGALQRLGVRIADFQNSVIVLMAVLVSVFLLVPHRKGASKTRLPWYDALLAIASLVASGYMFFFYMLPPSELTFRAVDANVIEIVLGLVLLATILEACRRSVGLVMLILPVLFLLYFFFANQAPGFLRGFSVDLPRGIAMLYLSTDGIWGTAMSAAASMIVVFLIFGTFLERGGAGTFYTQLASALLGHVRGGPAKVAVIGSCMFGMISGSPAANVATIGVITIPMMKNLGYRPEFAGAVEAVSSNGGPLMPPVMGIVAFVMAEWLGIPYWEICVSAFVPAFLYYFVEFIQVDREAIRMGLEGSPRESLPKLGSTLKSGWHFLIAPAVLVFLLAVLGFSPQTAAIWALLVLIVLSFAKKEKRNARWVVQALEGSAPTMSMVVPVCAAAGVIIASVVLTGLGFKFSSILISLAGGNLFVLLLFTAVASFVLGMGLPSLVSYIVLVILVAPAVISLGVLPLAAHLFVFWSANTAFITPPVALAVFIAAGIAGGDIWRTGLLAIRLGVVTFILPFVFVYQTGLLLKGSWESMVWGVSSALVACFAIACGLSGHLLKPTGWILRGVLLTGAILLLVPFSWMPMPLVPASWLAIPGILAIMAPLLYQMRAARQATRMKAASEPS